MDRHQLHRISKRLYIRYVAACKRIGIEEANHLHWLFENERNMMLEDHGIPVRPQHRQVRSVWSH